MTENPHWGIAPNKEPKMGPYFLPRVIIFLFFDDILCSINSIIKNAINRNGINFRVSIIVSLKIF